MTVRQRVLEARLAEKVDKNPALAKSMGIEIKYRERNSVNAKRKKYRTGK